MKLLHFSYKHLFSLGEGGINLSGRGLTLVTGYSKDETGANGAGKSSLANKGILFTMFGETAGGLRADAVLNRHTKKSCFGKLTFEGMDGQEYRVTRKRPSKLILERKGDKKWLDVSASTARATQLLINSALGFDAKTFLQTSVFGQGRSIHYPSLTPREQKAVLENILPMEEVDRWAAYAESQAKELKPAVTEANTELFGAQRQASTFKDLLTRCEQDGIQFEERKARSISGATEALAKIEEQFKPEKDQLEVMRSRLPSEEEDREALNAKIEQHTSESAVWLAESRGHLKSRDAARVSAGQWRSKVSSLVAQLHEIDQTEQCPVCRRDYDETTVTAVKDRVAAHTAQLEDARAKVKQSEDAEHYYTTATQQLESQIEAATKAIAELNFKLNQRGEYTQAKLDLERRIDSAAAEYRTTLTAAEISENPHLALYQRHQQDEAAAQQEVQTLTAKSTTLEKELSHLVHWKGVYGKELKLKLFEDACPFLDARTQYHLERLKNSQIHCDFSTVKRLATGEAKEEFDVTVWSETGGKGFESLSGGEQQMVSFAVGLALADLAGRMASSQSGFLILDEPFTELDDRNAEAVIEYLTAEVKSGRDTILLISNDEALKGLIPNRIHVVKEHGISNVEGL